MSIPAVVSPARTGTAVACGLGEASIWVQYRNSGDVFGIVRMAKCGGSGRGLRHRRRGKSVLPSESMAHLVDRRHEEGLIVTGSLGDRQIAVQVYRRTH